MMKDMEGALEPAAGAVVEADQREADTEAAADLSRAPLLSLGAILPMDDCLR